LLKLYLCSAKIRDWIKYRFSYERPKIRERLEKHWGVGLIFPRKSAKIQFILDWILAYIPYFNIVLQLNGYDFFVSSVVVLKMMEFIFWYTV
jgi:hypothetical protein